MYLTRIPISFRIPKRFLRGSRLISPKHAIYSSEDFALDQSETLPSTSEPSRPIMAVPEKTVERLVRDASTYTDCYQVSRIRIIVPNSTYTSIWVAKEEPLD